MNYKKEKRRAIAMSKKKKKKKFNVYILGTSSEWRKSGKR